MQGVAVAVATMSRLEKIKDVLSEEDVEDVLISLEKKTIVSRLDEVFYDFSDNVVREIVMGSVAGTAKRRKRLHARLAMNLMRRQSEEATDSEDESENGSGLLIAHHFCEGCTSLTTESERKKAAKFC